MAALPHPIIPTSGNAPQATASPIVTGSIVASVGLLQGFTPLRHPPETPAGGGGGGGGDAVGYATAS